MPSSAPTTGTVSRSVPSQEVHRLSPLVILYWQHQDEMERLGRCRRFSQLVILYWHHKDEMKRVGRCRRWFVQTFDKDLREHVYQFVDKDTADAMVVLEIEFYYPQLHIARRRQLLPAQSNQL